MQLEAWARTNAPSRAAALDSLLKSQSVSAGGSDHLSELRGQILSAWVDEASSWEEQLESATDERTKVTLGVVLFTARTQSGQLGLAGELLRDMEPDLRGPLSDILALKRATAAIASDRLEEAASMVAARKGSLHRVLAAASLAKAHWARLGECEVDPSRDCGAAARAMQIAIGAGERVPERLRPNARMMIAAILAPFGAGERALYRIELAAHELSADRSHERHKLPCLLSSPEAGEIAAAGGGRGGLAAMGPGI